MYDEPNVNYALDRCARKRLIGGGRWARLEERRMCFDSARRGNGQSHSSERSLWRWQFYLRTVRLPTGNSRPEGDLGGEADGDVYVTLIDWLPGRTEPSALSYFNHHHHHRHHHSQRSHYPLRDCGARHWRSGYAVSVSMHEGPPL